MQGQECAQQIIYCDESSFGVLACATADTLPASTQDGKVPWNIACSFRSHFRKGRGAGFAGR